MSSLSSFFHSSSLPLKRKAFSCTSALEKVVLDRTLPSHASPSSSPCAASYPPSPAAAGQEQRKRRSSRRKQFESRKTMKQENILFLVLLLCLASTAEAKGGRGGGRGGRSGGGGGGYLCFGQGCSGLDITITCLTLVLLIFTMCRCLRDCARCCDGGSEDEDYYETV